MAIELKQQLKISQQLVMTPQLQQAIKLLQLNRLELVTLVQQELQENPVLEENEGEDERATDAGEELAEISAEGTEGEAPESIVEAEAGTENEASDAEKIADVDWDDYMDTYQQTGGLDARASAEEDERRSLEATLAQRPSLTEHLHWQLQLSHFEPDEAEAAQWLIGNLDDDGYLKAELDEVARQSGIAVDVVERSLSKVQLFDPTGIAARDLRECLMIQVAALGIEDPLVVRIVDQEIELLRKRDFRKLAKVIGVTIEEVAAAAQVIGRLEPWPGRAFGGEDPVYITPDIYVYKVADEYHILLNEDGLPKLRINSLYRDVLARKPAAKGDTVAKDTKEYVNDKVRSAVWLIKSIHQRQRTIYKVMQSIIKYQREFFDRGVAHLRPLNLRDVADDIGMHESTVSRVTTNKYVHTPQGIFELKYFFNSSIERFDGGDAVSSESVKEKIRNIIANEDGRRPLSDQRIAEMLKSANINIARRTVTKYREQMNLLSSTKRRQVG